MSRAALVIALVCSIGLQWAILQTVAWAAMLADNLHSRSLAQAVERTFDGKHPCSLCKAIAKGKQSEKKGALQQSLKKMEFVCERRSFICRPASAFWELSCADETARALPFGPLPPPPRRLSV